MSEKITEEEAKKAEASLDQSSINKKIKETMLTIVCLDSPGDSLTVFKQVMESFNDAEKTQIVCTYIARQMKEMIEKDPEFLSMLRMLKMLKDAGQDISLDSLSSMVNKKK